MSCVRCGHELGIGRFCLNCGHPVGRPAPAHETGPSTLAETPTRRHQADRRRPSWVPWAVGAGVLLVLLGILAVLASMSGEDDDRPEGLATDPGQQSSESEAPIVTTVDLTRRLKVSAPAAAPPTTDLDGQLISYGPRRMVDGVPATAWRTVGDATGQTITFTLAESSSIRRVGLINGFARQVQSGDTLVDWYPNNRRITLVEWVFDDGTVVQQDLKEKSTLQRLTIEPVTTTDVQLRLLRVTAPGAGALGRDYTVISEILLAGTPAV
jgi:hypothetical protein